MYYLRTHVFSKEEKVVETAMAFACDIHELYITATTTAAPVRAVLSSRSILSTRKRSKCRNLLLPASAARKSKLSSELWARKRRRKFAAVDDDCRVEKLLFKLQFQQYNRFVGARLAPAVSRTDESTEERQPTEDAVRCHRSTSASVSANRLCARSASTDSRRTAASHCLPSVAMERSIRSQRDQEDTKMSQRKRPHLCLLQSRSLESTLSAR